MTARILLHGRAAGDDVGHAGPRGGIVGGQAGHHQHLAGQRHGQLGDVGGPPPLQGLEALDDFQRVADGTTEWSFHRGQHGPRGQSNPPANLHHRTRQLTGLGGGLHERAPPDLDVEDQRIGTLGDLLAHDGGRDQRHALDRARDVAKRVELLVGWRQVRGLPHEHAPKVGQDRQALGRRHVDSEPGDRLQLVDRAAGMPERAAGALGDHRAAGGDDGHDDERDLVAHTARAVLADLHPRQRRQVHAVPRSHHGVGQPRGLVGIQPPEHDGHQQRGGLVLRDRAVRDATNQQVDLGPGQLSAVAFSQDEIDDPHERGSIREKAAGISPARRVRVGYNTPVLATAFSCHR